MRRTIAAALLGAAVTALALTSTGAAGSGPPVAPVVAAYYAAFDPTLPVSEIDAGRLTDVIYAFGAVDSRGRCALAQPQLDVGPDPVAAEPGGNFGALAALAAAHPGLQTEISLGGWGPGSDYFSRAAATPARRAALVDSCIDLFLRRWPRVFDGFDIDWEFPVAGGAGTTPARPADRADATALLAEFRRRLDALGAVTHRHYLLTVAMPSFGTAGATRYTPETSWDLAAVAPVVDWINLMTYDMGGIAGRTGLESPLHAAPGQPHGVDTVDGAVRYYEASGVPADEIVIGAPFYGHVFVGVHSRNAGLFERFRKAGGVPSYAQIAASDPTATQLHWSPSAQEPWLYYHRHYTFVSFDDAAAMSAKANYAVAHGLRGVMLWEIAMDDADHTLLNALSGPVLASRP